MSLLSEDQPGYSKRKNPLAGVPTFLRPNGTVSCKAQNKKRAPSQWGAIGRCLCDHGPMA